MDIQRCRAKILTRQMLLEGGMKESDLRRHLRSGRLRRLRPGTFVEGAEWDAAYTEERHLLKVIATDSARRGADVVFSHVSALAVRNLPLFRSTPQHVHTSGPRTDAVARPRSGVAHHGVEVAAVDHDEVDGIPCTSLEKTVFDVIRTESRETAIAAADAALRQVAWHESERSYDLQAAEQWRASLAARIGRARGARGICQAREITALADGRAASPGESVSRLYIADLGFEVPRIQVPFAGPRGEQWEIDFGLDDVRAWGEFDGLGKYTDEVMLDGKTTAETLLNEKHREDWIRGRTQWKFARWGMSHIATASTLAARLAFFHIHPPR